MSTTIPEGEPRTFSQADVDRIVRDRLGRDREQRSSVRVISEPRTYAADGPNSYFADLARTALDRIGLDPFTAQAGERLSSHVREVAHEVERGTVEGRQALRALLEGTRTAEAHEHRLAHERAVRELRATTSGGGGTATATSGAAAFIPPYYLNEYWAPWRGVYRTFADQCFQLPLPPYGMQVALPAFSSTDSVTNQSPEGSVASEIDPATQLQTASVVTLTGNVVITQQMLDRGFQGGALDIVYARDMQQRLDEQTDRYALNVAMAAGGVVTGSPTFTIDNFYADLATARESITDTAGIRLRPTHVFSTYDFYSFCARKTDINDRPYFQPDVMPGSSVMPYDNADHQWRNGGPTMPKWARFTGSVLPAGLLWFTDDNIVASGANSQLIVSSPDQSVYLFEAEPTITTTPTSSLSQNMQVVVNLRNYVAVLTRHGSGTVVVTGNAYSTSYK